MIRLFFFELLYFWGRWIFRLLEIEFQRGGKVERVVPKIENDIFIWKLISGGQEAGKGTNLERRRLGGSWRDRRNAKTTSTSTLYVHFSSARVQIPEEHIVGRGQLQTDTNNRKARVWCTFVLLLINHWDVVVVWVDDSSRLIDPELFRARILTSSSSVYCLLWVF